MVTVDLIKESEEQLPFDPQPLFEKVAEEVLRSEGCSCDVQVSVSLVDDEEIRERNREFRGIDSVTDVLSFPLVPFPAPADFRFLETEEAADCFDPDTGELCLGDIVLACQRGKQQAAEYGHSQTREFAFLTAHSMLHLLGYDHETEEEAAVMEARQEAVLQSLGITRERKDG